MSQSEGSFEEHECRVRGSVLGGGSSVLWRSLRWRVHWHEAEGPFRSAMRRCENAGDTPYSQLDFPFNCPFSAFSFRTLLTYVYSIIRMGLASLSFVVSLSYHCSFVLRFIFVSSVGSPCTDWSNYVLL